MLCTRFGAGAGRLIAEERFGEKVANRSRTTFDTPISEAVGKPRTISLDSDIIMTGRAVGVCFGD